jgi:Fe-S-cluster containining protein
MASADSRLLVIIDNAMDDARHRSGQALHCAKGCFGCCIGPFPITAMDARRLRDALTALPAPLAQAIRSRALEAAAALSPHYPGDIENGRLHEERADELFDNPRLNGVPCPALDLESGACLVYDARPIACRSYGPAITLEGRALPHCRLNYRDLTPEQVEACRVTIDPGDAGPAAAREFEASGGQPYQTVVAFALRSA